MEGDRSIARYTDYRSMLSDHPDIQLVAIATESGIPQGTISGWLVDKYAGDNHAVASRVERWLESRAERAKVRSAVPAGPHFVPTETAQQIMQVLEQTAGAR